MMKTSRSVFLSRRLQRESNDKFLESKNTSKPSYARLQDPSSVYNYRFVMRMLPECVNFFLQRFVIFRHKIISIFANVVEPSCPNFFTFVIIGKCLKNIHTGEHFCCFLYMHLLYPDWPLHLYLFFTSDLFYTVTSLSSLSLLICDFTKLWKLQV